MYLGSEVNKVSDEKQGEIKSLTNFIVLGAFFVCNA